MNADGGNVARNWSDQEIDIALEGYFFMFRCQMLGIPYSKSVVRQSLRASLRRSDKSLEYKWMNVSAILDELDYPWVRGYKPAANYQRRLRERTILWLKRHPNLKRLLGSEA